MIVPYLFPDIFNRERTMPGPSKGSKLAINVRPVLPFILLIMLTFNLSLTCGYAIPALCNRSWVKPPCWRCGRNVVRSADCLTASICYDGRVVNEVKCTGGQVYSMQARVCIWPDDKRWYDCGINLPRKPLDHVKTTNPPTHKPTHKPTYRPTEQPHWSTWGPVTHGPTQPKWSTWGPVTKAPTLSTRRSTEAPTRAPFPGPALPVTCGVKTEPFIVGGQLSDEGEWPWEVSITQYYSNTDTYRHTCGGALITDQWMLTAAHCVSYEESLYNMVLNNYNLYLESGNEITVGVSKIIQHPDFVDNRLTLNFPNDIALVKFSDKVELDLVMPICLPDSELTFSNADDCWVAGWGDTRGTGARQVLNELKVQFTNISQCKEAWGEDLILPSHMCVGDGMDGACLGDSGGPLMCSKNGQFYVAGVTSWGHGSCQVRGFPNVYTRTSDFTDWIIKTIESN